MKKIMLSITIAILILSSYIIPCIAAPTIPQVKEEAKLGESIRDLLNSGKNFISGGESQQKDQNNQPLTIDEGLLGDTVGFIYKIVLSIASLLVVIVGMIIGIQFMMASSADEKAKWKETLKVYVVGVIVIYGALGIWYFILNILNNIN